MGASYAPPALSCHWTKVAASQHSPMSYRDPMIPRAPLPDRLILALSLAACSAGPRAEVVAPPPPVAAVPATPAPAPLALLRGRSDGEIRTEVIDIDLVRRNDLIGYGPRVLVTDPQVGVGLRPLALQPLPPTMPLGLLTLRGVPLGSAAKKLASLFKRELLAGLPIVPRR